MALPKIRAVASFMESWIAPSRSSLLLPATRANLSLRRLSFWYLPDGKLSNRIKWHLLHNAKTAPVSVFFPARICWQQSTLAVAKCRAIRDTVNSEISLRLQRVNQKACAGTQDFVYSDCRTHGTEYLRSRLEKLRNLRERFNVFWKPRG